MADRIAKYRVVRRLGMGGMGEVFLAEDTELERSVAVKVMSTELAKDPEQRKRFRTEAKAASSLVHPNICVIHEVGETEEGRPFLAMEYVEGQTAAMLAERRRLKAREVVEIGIQVAAGLEAAHGRHIIHRDIKPENIIVDRSGRTKVLDFGLAKRLAPDELGATSSLAQTKTGVLLGTPYYMSPEQVLGRDVDHRTDIFSLGTVLYELIAGQRPFLGRTFGEAINNVVNHQPEPLRPDNPLLPESLERVVFKCLEKDPAKRYPSARALSEDLAEVRRELEQTAPSPLTSAPPSALISGPRNAPETRGRSAVPVWIPGLAALLLLLAAFGAFIASRHVRQTAGPMADKGGGVGLQHRSVAVLPLDNFTGDPENDYLSDGLTEEITTALSRISGLKVAARNSAFAFKGRKQDARKVGEALRVSTLLEGSVRKMGKQIRVTAQLINVADGFHLWSETYDRSADDIIGVQEDIARRIAERLQGKVDLPPQPAVDPEAHRLYLQARLFWNKRTEAGLNRAVQLFQQAIDKQPSYAAAHAGLAATYVVLPQYSLAARASHYRPLARAAAQRALELDAGCAEAHAVLGHLQSELKDFRGAEEHFQNAIRLAPNYATAHHWYGLYLGTHGQKQKALNEFLAAMELDPLSPVIRTVVSQWYYLQHDFDRAIVEYRKVIEDFPEFPLARDLLVAAFLQKGQYEEALAELDKVLPLRSGQPLAGLEMKAYALARAGRTDEARKIKADLEQQRAKGDPVEVPLILVYLGFREYDNLLDILEKMFASGDLPCELLSDPMFDECRELPRFQQLLQSSGIE
jgi:serine/threonine protein kinase/TolB-like protein/Tfp pilus assembly protein PilF